MRHWQCSYIVTEYKPGFLEFYCGSVAITTVTSVSPLIICEGTCPHVVPSGFATYASYFIPFMYLCISCISTPLPTSLSSIPSSLIKKRTTLKKIVKWERTNRSPAQSALSLVYTFNHLLPCCYINAFVMTLACPLTYSPYSLNCFNSSLS